MQPEEIKDKYEEKSISKETSQHITRYSGEEILFKIEKTQNRINYLKTLYEMQELSVAKKRKKQRNKMIAWVAILEILILFSGYEITLGNSFLIFTVFIIGVIAFIIIMIQLIKAGYIYLLNASPQKFERYVSKNQLHTLNEEEVFCRDILGRLSGYEKILRKYENNINNYQNFSREEMYNQLLGMNLEKTEFHYDIGSLSNLKWW